MLYSSINARKLLPYQDYLLYKPSGCERTKTYFQQKSHNDVTGSNGGDECHTATLNEESDLTVVDLGTSHVLPPSKDMLDILVNNAECGKESALQNIPGTEPSDQHISLPGKSAVIVAGDKSISTSLLLTVNATDEVSEISSSSIDYEQMSAENRKRVSEFFSHSRLHHISTWGAEYKAYVTQLQSRVSRGINEYYY